jgi:hypothetical protein
VQVILLDPATLVIVKLGNGGGGLIVKLVVLIQPSEKLAVIVTTDGKL